MRATLYLPVVLIVTSCASTPPPVAPSPTSDATPSTVTQPGDDAIVFNDPQIDGHPVGQCVTGQGWGAFDRGRCGPESQRIIANQFCAAQQPSGTATDWELGEGAKGHHSVWRYGRGTAPAEGNWIRMIASDGFAQIRCKPSKESDGGGDRSGVASKP